MPFPEFYWPPSNPVEIQVFDLGIELQVYDSGRTVAIFPHSRIRTRLSFSVLNSWKSKIKALYDFYKEISGPGVPFFIADPWLTSVGADTVSDKPTEGREFLAFASGVGPYALARQNVMPDSEVVYLNGTSLTGAQEVTDGVFAGGLASWVSTPASGSTITTDKSHSRDSGYCVRVNNRGSGSKFSEIKQHIGAIDNSAVYRISARVYIPTGRIPAGGVILGLLNSSTNLPVPSHGNPSVLANITTKVGRYQYIESYVTTGFSGENSAVTVRAGVLSSFVPGDLEAEAETYIDSISVRKVQYTLDHTAGALTLDSVPTPGDDLEIDYLWYRKMVFIDPSLPLEEFSTRVFDVGIGLEEAY